MLPCRLALLCGALAIAAPTAALPVISHDLHLGPAQTSAVAAAHQLACGPLQLGAGRLADRYGPRRVLAAALALFAAGGLLAATAVNGPSLIAARLMQGAGGSALSPVSLALVLRGCPAPEDEPRAVAGWVATAALASSLGPLLGGSLAGELGWPAVFAALAALAACTLAGVLALPTGGGVRNPAPLDVRGIALCTATAGAVLVALTLPAAGAPAPAAAAAAATAGGLLALTLRHARRQDHAALDTRLLRESPARRALLVLLALFCAHAAFAHLTWFALAHGHGLGPLRSSLVTLPSALPAVVASRLAAARAGRPLMRAGLLCLAVGLLTGSAGYRDPTPLWLTGCACALAGCGLGLANGAAMATVTARRDPRHTAAATATATAFAMLGGASGPAVAAAALTALTPGTPWPYPPQATHLTLSLLALTTAATALTLTRRSRNDESRSPRSAEDRL
ncbi:MFS transporter [Streptomyces sp. NPDC053048]|uniref:MFS transporter n=1 Tax=Streptomyces sp. NPDC053048 TaxID=3365694 RepID=UPI0037D3DD17